MDYKDVRHGLVNALSTIPAIQDTGSPTKGKVFREWTTPADTPKPFLEYAFDGEIPSISAGNCALHMGVEILCFGDPDDILDKLADDVVTLLDQKPFITPTGKTPELQYMRDSHMDIWSEQLKAHGIRLKFWLPSQFWT